MDPFLTYAGINIVKSIVDGFQQNKKNLMQQSFQQSENEASRVAQRENILLQLREQRVRDALSFENHLREHDYVSMGQNSWPLKIPPREYGKLFHPNEFGQIPFNLIIDNRIQTRIGCLCDSLWDKLADGLRYCFGDVRPYRFNSDIFTKSASGAGGEISLLCGYSEHIPTLVLVPRYEEEELRLEVSAWGCGIGFRTDSISLRITDLRIEIARKLTDDYKNRYDKAKKAGVKDIQFDETFSRYVEMFRREAELLDKGMSREDCRKLGVFKELSKVAALNEVSDIEKDVYKNVARALAQQILVPIGLIIDGYFIEELGLAPRLPFILSRAGLDVKDCEKIILSYASTLIAEIESENSILGEAQFDEFKRSVGEAGFCELSRGSDMVQLKYPVTKGSLLHQECAEALGRVVLSDLKLKMPSFNKNNVSVFLNKLCELGLYGLAQEIKKSVQIKDNEGNQRMLDVPTEDNYGMI